MANEKVREIQRYAMEPTYGHSMCTLDPLVALVKHPHGQVVLYSDHAARERELLEALRLAQGMLEAEGYSTDDRYADYAKKMQIIDAALNGTRADQLLKGES